MKKAFDQTVRDLKREVNKTVLKVPRTEQKILDATSNEPWGPHGSLLADIAEATRNFHDYQMIMSVIWKRINDTGKNWRHVYKGLTVLEYLVAHGSERVIEEIREHAYQISTLSDFQYIDSNGRDQGNNVRKKSQSLVVLVNDKERIIEVRQKAAANRDKFWTSSVGGMYRPGSFSSTGGYGDRYDDDRREGSYRSRDEDRYGREREYGYRDDDRYGRNGDPHDRDGNRYGRDSRRDDDYWERSQSVEDYYIGSRSRSSDQGRDRASDDDGQYSSRGSGARVDDLSQDGRRLDRKFSEQNIGTPPSYEEAVNESRSPVHSERDGETATAVPSASSPARSAPGASSPAMSAPTVSSSAMSAPSASSPPYKDIPRESTPTRVTFASPTNQEVQASDDFDPRGSVTASPTSNNTEMDLLGALSDSFNPLAITLVEPATSTTVPEPDLHTNQGPTFAATLSASNAVNQSFEDPFGDTPFKAIPSNDTAQAQPQASVIKPDTVSSPEFGNSFSAITYPTFNIPESSTPAVQNVEILADILPPTGSIGQATPPNANIDGNNNIRPQPGPKAIVTLQGQSSQSQTGQVTNGMWTGQSQAAMNPYGSNAQLGVGSFYAQQNQTGRATPLGGLHQISPGPGPLQHGDDPMGNFLPKVGMNPPMASQQPPSKDKFETKSTVWADTLSRGLVNLNISGPKTNSLADIGIDFDAINRRDKRMQKPSTAPVASTVTMGKAMGSGSGVGQAGATALRPQQTPMMGSGMSMGGTYGSMNQPMGMGMGMNNMGMGRGGPMQQPTGFPPRPNMYGGYNPSIGYTPQRSYGGGYR